MIFYIFFLLLITGLLALQYYYSKEKSLLEIVVIFIIIIVSGFRYKVGYDYDSYVSWYLNKNRDSDFEFGFVSIMNLFRWLNLSPSFLFFFFSFFTCLFVYLGIKKHTVYSNTALLFYIMIPGLYLSSFSFIRQSFSIAISFYAFYYLRNKKYLLYFILMFVGISIHYSCLIPFILFLFVFQYGNKIKINHLLILIFFSLFFSFFDLTSFFEVLFKNSRYLYYFLDQNPPVNIWKIILINLEGIIILFYYKKKGYTESQNLIVLYCISIFFLNVCRNHEELTRITFYFRIFEIIIVSDLIFQHRTRIKVFLFSLFYILYCGAFFNALKKDLKIKNKHIRNYIPYDNILWDSRNKLSKRLY